MVALYDVSVTIINYKKVYEDLELKPESSIKKDVIALIKSLIPQLCREEWSKQERVGYQQKAFRAKK